MCRRLVYTNRIPGRHKCACCIAPLPVVFLISSGLALAQAPDSTAARIDSSRRPGRQARPYTVPAGTKVLLHLQSAINTKSAKAGDGVYLASTFPVVVGNRVMIPAGVYVQGVVDRVERAGHVKGRAQLDLHFTSIIFPNGSVVEIPGVVNRPPRRAPANRKEQW